ncbi:suppressor protein stp22 of temperature-sensitive alpha-factor receptor and arginine permease [Coemansia sp. Benny D160-2]|nr:suppressor protein stp22 of temperature-sensitive alpha-factor receptor and arginine permease [Coemansia sp. Benny D160-2]
MVIKVSKHVDGRGRVYHPYMAGWSGSSTLVELFQNLIVLFSNEPPVYSTPASAVGAASNSLTASPQMPLGSVSMSTLPHVGTLSMSSLPSMGAMSMHSLPQSVPAAMPISASNSPRPVVSVPHSPAFVRPISTAEEDLASLNTMSSASNHGAQSQSMAPPPHIPSISIDAAEQGVANPSIGQGSQHQTSQALASEPVQAAQQPQPQSLQQDQKQQQQNEKHGVQEQNLESSHGQEQQQRTNNYKFNPVAGRPPIPTLNSSNSASNPESISTITTGGTLAVANPNAGTTVPDARPCSYASESDTMSERAKRWSTTDSALSFNDAPDEEQTPLNAASTTQPGLPPATSIDSTSTAGLAHALLATAASKQVGSEAVVTPTTATSASVSIPDTAVAKATASPTRPTQQSSLLDDQPMDDPQKRLLGYKLAMLDKVVGAVDRSREKHTRVNKELLDQSANLNSGAGVIAEERHQLLESQRQLSANISVLENKLNELNEKKGEFPDVSQIKNVCHIFRGQTPAMEQLFNLSGEISAIDDTIYMLGKALNDGKLPLGIYMRQIRKLAQQQFMAKALAFKIRELCSLDR